MIFIKETLLFLILAISLKLFPVYAYEDNYIQCEKHNEWWSFKCLIKDRELFPKQDDEQVLTVDYDFDCHCGTQNSKILEFGILDENSNHAVLFKYGKKDSLEIVGIGPFRTVDLNLKKSSGRRHYHGCSLRITSMTTRPSERTISNWHQSLLDVNAIVESLEHVVNYKAAYSFMNDLTSMFYSELTSEQQLLLSKHGKEISSMIPLIVQKYAKNPGPESQSVITTLVKMMGVLNDIKGESNWIDKDGNRKKIEDFLSQKDKEILEKISNDGLSIKDAKQKLEDTLKRKVILEAKLKHYSNHKIIHDEL